MALSPQQKVVILNNLSRSAQKRYEEGTITDDQLEKFGRAAGLVEDRADFSGVSATTDTTARPEGGGYWSDRFNELGAAGDEISAAGEGLAEAGKGGIQSLAGGLAGRLGYSFETGGDLADIAKAFIPESLEAQFDKNVRTGLSPYQPASRAAIDTAGSLMTAADVNRREAESIMQRGIAPGAGFEIAEAASDFAGSPSSALSVFGGPFGVAGIADVYNQEYVRARQAGLSAEDADTHAKLQAAPEAIGIIPAGKFLSKFVPDSLKNKVVNELSTTAARYGSRLAATMGGEAAEEALTSVLQTGANAIIAETSDDEAARAYAEQQLPRNTADFWEQTWRSAKAGAFGGGAIGSVHAGIETAAENGRLAADALSGFKATEDLRSGTVQGDTAPSDAITPVPLDEWADYDAQRKADEMEAGFRTLQREAEARDLRNAAAAVPGAEASPMAQAFAQAQIAPITAESVAAERLAPQTPQEAPQAAPVQAATTVAPEAAVKPLTPAQQRRTAVAELGYPEQQIRRMTAARQQQIVDEQIAPEDLGPDETPVPRLSEADLRARFARNRAPSLTADQSTGTTATQVMDGIVQRIGGNKQANILGKLVADGKVVIVDNASQIPGGAPANSAGFYDGDKTYIVADKVNPDNVIGDSIFAAAHEVKHGADESGNADLATMANFIGDTANDRIVKKVEALATAGNTVAAAAVKAAKAGSNTDTYSRELPAYLINAAQTVRGSKGAVSGVISDIVSAIRSNAKSKMGITDVNLDDVNYLANKMLETAALSKGSLASATGATRADPLTLGESAATFEQAAAEGRTYLSVDGKNKFTISDKDSDVRIGPDIRDKLDNGNKVTLGQALKHDELFRNYPQLQFVRVRKPSPSELKYMGGSEASAFWDKATNSIVVSDQTLKGGTGRYGPVHEMLIHEAQHAIQDLEGSTNGTNLRRMMSADERKIVDSYDKVFNKNKATVDPLLKAAQGMLPELGPRTAKQVQEIVYSSVPSVMKAYELNNLLRDSGINLPELDAYDATFQEVANARKARSDVIDSATQKYLRVLGEREAYLANENLQRTPEQVEEQEGFVTNPETMWKANGGIFDATGTRLAMSNEVFNDMRAMLNGRKSVLTGKNIAGQFKGFGVLGRELGNVKELADGEAAMTAFVAEGDYGRVGFGIRNMADKYKKANKVSTKEAVKAVSQQVEQRIEAIGKIEDEGRRQAALATYVQAHPELRPLMDAINHINQNTDEIIAARMRDPKPLTADELVKYNAMLDNKYAYFTRTYAAFQGKEGRNRNTKLEREYQIAKDQAARGKNISPKYQNAFDTYSRALKFVANNDVGVFDPEHLATVKPEHLDFLYSTWVDDPDVLRAQIAEQNPTASANKQRAMFKDMAITQIAEVGENVDQTQVIDKSEHVVNGLLGLNEQSNPVVAYYRGFKEDQGILQRREKVPEEIRELFGEVKDLPTKIAITLAKQGELAARMRMLATIRENGEGKWYMTPKNRTGKFTEQLKGEEWGPLRDMYVEPQIAAGINEGLDIYTSLSNALAQGHSTVDRAAEQAGNLAARFARKAASLQKYTGIVLSPFATVANAIGSPLILAQNGVVDIAGIVPNGNVHRARMAALRLISNQIAPGGIVGKAGAPARNADLELFLKYGLLDSAIGQELRSTPTKFLKKLIADTEGTTTLQEFNNKFNTAMRTLSSTKGAITETFALSDAWVKPAIFLDRADTLKKFYEAEGIEKSQDEIYQEAADLTKDTTITFQRAAPVVKLGERLGVTQFAPYFQGVFRSVMYSYGQGLKDLLRAANAKTPRGQLVMATSGVRRIGGSLAATVGIAQVTKALADMYNDDDDDEMIDGARKLMFPEARFGNGVYLGKDEEGNHQFIRLSRLDPLGPMNDLFRIAMSDAPAETKQKAIVNAVVDLWIKPRATADLFKVGASIFSEEPQKDKKTKVERLLPETTRKFKTALREIADHDTAEAIVQFVDDFVPGALNAFDEDNKAPKTDSSAAAQTVATSLLALGGRLDSANAGLAAVVAGKELVKLQKDGRDEINEALRTSGVDAAFQRYLDVREDEYDAKLHLKDVYDGIVQTTGSPRQAMAALKDAGVTAQDIALIRQGRIETKYSNLLSEKSIIQSGKFQDRGLSPEETKAAEAERKEAIKRLKLMNREGGN